MLFQTFIQPYIQIAALTLYNKYLSAKITKSTTSLKSALGKQISEFNNINNTVRSLLILKSNNQLHNGVEMKLHEVHSSLSSFFTQNELMYDVHPLNLFGTEDLGPGPRLGLSGLDVSDLVGAGDSAPFCKITEELGFSS